MFKYFKDGIFKNNPILVLMLGLCSTVAISNTVTGSIGMSVAVIFVVVCSNIIISIFRKLIPSPIRIPVFIVIISTFVTIVDYLLLAYHPDIHGRLGIFVPLIVVNCLVLARAEMFASKQGIVASFFDGLGVGAGYAVVTIGMGIIRELFGSGTLFGKVVLGRAFAESPILFMVLPPGGFLTIGLLMGLVNWSRKKREEKEARQALETASFRGIR